MNYHGFAAQLLDALRHARRHRAGAARAHPGAARGAVRAGPGPDDVRVREDREPGRRDRQHPAARRSGGEPSPHARRDHRVQRGSGWSSCKEHRSDRAYRSALERIELAKAAPRSSGELKRDLGVIDFGDQIALRARGRRAASRRWPPSTAQRFGAVLLDEYQDTNVAQAQLIAGVFGDGHPGDGGGRPRPEHLRVARRQPVQPAATSRSSSRAPTARRPTQLPLYTNFRSGARILEAADVVIATAARRSSGRTRTSGSCPWVDERHGRGARRRGSPTSGRRREWIADRIVELHDDGADVVRRRRAVPHVAGCSSRCSRRSPNGRSRRRSSGSPGCCGCPRSSRSWRTPARCSDPLASVALARILLGPRYRVGFKDLALRRARSPRCKSYALRVEDEDDGEATPFLFAEALEHLDEVEGLSEEGRARLEEFREELADAARSRRGKPVGEFLGEVDPADRHPRRARRRPGPASRPPRRKRNLAAFLDEVHAFEPVEGELTLRAFLDYVDAVERLDKQEWSPVQPSDEDSVKVMTIHAAKGLEFDNVFVPGMAKGLLPEHADPAEPGRARQVDGLRAPRRRRRSCRATTASCSTSRSSCRRRRIIEERRTAYVALTRARKRARCHGRALVRREHQREGRRAGSSNELAAMGRRTAATRGRGTAARTSTRRRTRCSG